MAIGVESDIQVSHINDSSSYTVTCCIGIAGPNGVLTRAQNLDWFGTVRGRLGLAIWDRTLVYGTAGLMYGEEVVNSNLVFPAIGYQATSSGTHSGWTAGGGIEYAFTNNISAKLEGLYYNLGTETITAGPNPTTPAPFAETTSSPTRERWFASVQTSSSGPLRRRSSWSTTTRCRSPTSRARPIPASTAPPTFRATSST
jgi:opacity protein-like surface antigen